MRVFRSACIAVLFAALCGAQDPGRPVLKRGGAADKHEPVPRPDSKPTASSEKPPYAVIEVDEEGRGTKSVSSKPLTPDQELIERARQAANEFNVQLPNFICNQAVTRFKGEGLRPKWKQQDRIQVELVYFEDKEDYQNVRINGKRIKKGSPEDSGQWSTGEFGTMLRDIFADNTNAEFRPRPAESEAAGLKARVFNFTVGQEGAHWEIRMGRPVRPPYQGAVWIDPDTARVLRIEMDTHQLPADYAVDKVEMVVDYDWVDISGTKYLLPARSQNLSCVTGTVTCTKNEIQFVNYRKFSTESLVLETDSDVTFPTDDEVKAGKKPDYVPPTLDPEKAKVPVKKKQ